MTESQDIVTHTPILITHRVPRDSYAKLRSPLLCERARIRLAVEVIEADAADHDTMECDFGGSNSSPQMHGDVVFVDVHMTLDEYECTWPDARTPWVDPWYGDGNVDRANAWAREQAARFLLRAIDRA